MLFSSNGYSRINLAIENILDQVANNKEGSPYYHQSHNHIVISLENRSDGELADSRNPIKGFNEKGSSQHDTEKCSNDNRD